MENNLKKALDWWNNLPIQNLENMEDSLVNYCMKYYSKSPYEGLSNEQILHIWSCENKKEVLTDEEIKFMKSFGYPDEELLIRKQIPNSIKSFQYEKDHKLIHIIGSGSSGKYFVIEEDTSKGHNLIQMNKEQIKEIYGITI